MSYLTEGVLRALPEKYDSASSGGGTQNGLMVWALMVNVDLGKTSTILNL